MSFKCLFIRIGHKRGIQFCVISSDNKSWRLNCMCLPVKNEFMPIYLAHINIIHCICGI